MDGVLADFFTPLAKHHGVSHWRKARRIHDKVDKIASKPGFFSHLKILSNAKRLITGVVKLAGYYSILSSPLQAEVEQSSKEKSEWLQKHFKSPSPHSVLFDHEKFKYARQANGTPNILIDDYDTNIYLWEANGGIGILYKNKKCDQALRQLHDALTGEFKHTYNVPLAILQKKIEQATEDVDVHKKLWTNREVIKYVKSIHDDYKLTKPILAHKTWILKMIPTNELSSPEHYDQDDPYRRVIDLDWDHISDITKHDIMNRPLVADNEGWVLDGNHRIAAARAAGIKLVPVLVPYINNQ